MPPDMQGVFDHIVTVDQSPAACGRKKTSQDSHTCRFTRAVWSQEADDITFFDSKGNILDSPDGTVVFCQRRYFDHGLPAINSEIPVAQKRNSGVGKRGLCYPDDMVQGKKSIKTPHYVDGICITKAMVRSIEYGFETCQGENPERTLSLNPA
jgi:hypothetical protein